MGDVTGMSFLDSTALSQANVAIDSISGQESRYDPQWTPRCIHTEPPVASVGWAENEAARSEIEFKVVSGSMRLVSDDDRSVIDPVPTFLKAIVESGPGGFWDVWLSEIMPR